MSNAWAGGSTRQWREVVRPAVLARDGYRCTLALLGTWRTRTQDGVHCLGVANTVHHKHGKNRCAGCKADRLDHLAAACTPCNLRVGDPGRTTTSTAARNPRPKVVTQW